MTSRLYLVLSLPIALGACSTQRPEDPGALGAPLERTCADTDVDGDGHDACSDCDDDDPDAFPGAPDPFYDGNDTDCAGNDDWDGDSDGDALWSDCDDESAALSTVDLDGDGVSSCDGDCDDHDPSVLPAAERVCGDEMDNDCDGLGDCHALGAFPVVSLPTYVQLQEDRVLRLQLPEGVPVMESVLAVGLGPGFKSYRFTTAIGGAMDESDAVLEIQGGDIAFAPMVGDDTLPDIALFLGGLWGPNLVHVYDGTGVGELAPGDAQLSFSPPVGTMGAIRAADPDGDGQYGLISRTEMAWALGAPRTSALWYLSLADAYAPGAVDAVVYNETALLEEMMVIDPRMDDYDGDGIEDPLACSLVGEAAVILSGPGILGIVTAEEVGTVLSGVGVAAPGGDVNGDGHADLVATLAGVNTRAVAFGPFADGDFEAQAQLFMDLGLFQGVGDVDGDGVPDLQIDAEPVSLIYGAPTAGWVDRLADADVWLDHGAEAHGYLYPLGDVNQDGLDDVVVNYVQTGRTYFLYGSSSDGF